MVDHSYKTNSNSNEYCEKNDPSLSKIDEKEHIKYSPSINEKEDGKLYLIEENNESYNQDSLLDKNDIKIGFCDKASHNNNFYYDENISGKYILLHRNKQ